MSIFIMVSRASRTGTDLVSSSISPWRTVGTICQWTPNLSWIQPHWMGLPPSARRSQYPSSSSCVSQLTTKEMAGVNSNGGMPSKVVNGCPFNTRDTTSLPAPGPSGSVVTLTMRESRNVDT